jgi:hypothetical protein
MMRNVRYGVIAVLLLSFVSTAGYAQNFTVHGRGLDSCGKYLSAAHDQPPGRYHSFKGPQGAPLFDEHGLYVQWLLGFITATNMSSVSAGTGSNIQNIQTDAAAIDVWMRKWCDVGIHTGSAPVGGGDHAAAILEKAFLSLSSRGFDRIGRE